MKRQFMAGTALTTILAIATLATGPALAQDPSQADLLERIEKLEKRAQRTEGLDPGHIGEGNAG